MGRHRRLGTGLALAWLAVIVFATLRPVPDPHHRVLLTPIECLVCGDEGGADVGANLLLFIPFAIGLRLAGLSWRRTVGLGAALSFTVELLQLTVVPGRDASLSDLLTNTASTAAGAGLAPLVPAVIRPTAGGAWRLLTWGAAVCIVSLAASAWLLMPAVPGGALLSRWAHATPATAAFGGQVRRVRLDGADMPKDGPPPDAGALRRRVAATGFTLEADVVSGKPVNDRLGIYMLEAGPRGALTLYQYGRDVSLAAPVRGLQLRLRPVTLTIAEGLPPSAGVPVALRASEHGRTLRLSSSHGGARHSVELGISPALGWMLFAPFRLRTGPLIHWITAVILGTALLPLGHWGRRSGGGARAAGLLAATVVVCLAVVPALAGFPPVHWSEWAAAAGSSAAGWALGPSAAYLQRRCASPSDSDSSSS